MKEVFPDATIMRPANVFGAEDRFLNYYASEYVVLSVAFPVERILFFSGPLHACLKSLNLPHNKPVWLYRA